MWTWLLAAFVFLPAAGVAACLALDMLKRPDEKAKDGKTDKDVPSAAPMPKGFRFLDEDDAADVKEQAKASAEPPECEILECKGDEEAPAIAFLVGNPGCPLSYTTFGRCMQEELAELHEGKKATVYIVGLANFVSRREYLGPPLGVREEMDRVARALEKIAPRHRKAGLMLVSHSCTCWMLLQSLLEALRHGTGCLAGARIPLVLFAAPYLEFDKDQTLQYVLRLFLWRWFTPYLIGMLTKLYLGLSWEAKAWIMKDVMHAKTEEDVQILLATCGRQRHHLRGMLGLASDFFRVIAKGTITSGFFLMEELLKEDLRPVIAAFYCENGDDWASLSHMRRLGSLFMGAAGYGGPGCELGCLGDVEHNFIQDPEQSRTAAKAIAPTLDEAWKRAAAIRPLPASEEEVEEAVRRRAADVEVL